MNKTRLVLCLAALFVAGGLYLAHAQTAPAPKDGDPRLDKIITQNEQILKNQDDLKKTLDSLRQDVLQLRRRSS